MSYYFGSVADFFLKFRNHLWSMIACIHFAPNYLSIPYWHSLLPKKCGNCVHEITVPWFLYALLTLCSSAAIEHRPFSTIKTPFPPFLWSASTASLAGYVKMKYFCVLHISRENILERELTDSEIQFGEASSNLVAYLQFSSTFQNLFGLEIQMAI